jgi:hypothetical protein
MPFVPEKSILHGTRSGLNLRVTKDIDELSSQENVVDILHSIVFLAAHSCNMTFEEVKKAGEMAKEKAGIGNVGREFQKGKLFEGKSPSETYRESEEKDFAEEDKRLAKLFTTFSARVQKLCARAGIFLGDENLGLRFNIVWEIIGKDMEQFKDVFPKKDKEAVGEELVTYNKAKEKFEAVEKQVQQEVKSHIIIAPAA